MVAPSALSCPYVCVCIIVAVRRHTQSENRKRLHKKGKSYEQASLYVEDTQRSEWLDTSAILIVNNLLFIFFFLQIWVTVVIKIHTM